jgi:hypothetical protein
MDMNVLNEKQFISILIVIDAIQDFSMICDVVCHFSLFAPGYEDAIYCGEKAILSPTSRSLLSNDADMLSYNF